MADNLSSKATFSVFVGKPRDEIFEKEKKDKFLPTAALFYLQAAKDVDVLLRPHPTILKDYRMLTLLREIAHKANPYILICNHASETDGLFFDIGSKYFERVWERMGVLLLLLELRRAERVCRRTERIQDWKLLARRIPEKFPTWDKPNDMLLAVLTTERSTGIHVPDGTSLAFVHQTVLELLSGWRAHLMRLLQVDAHEIVALVNALEAVHALKLQRVEIRGCDLGSNSDLTKLTGIFLGTFQIRAPRRFISMTYVHPEVDPNHGVFKKAEIDPNTKKPVARPVESAVYHPVVGFPHRSGRTFGYEYTFGSLPPDKDQVLFMSAEITELSSVTRLIAESEESLTEFVRRKVGLPRGKARITANNLVYLQFLVGRKPIFPGEPRFTEELADFYLYNMNPIQ